MGFSIEGDFSHALKDINTRYDPIGFVFISIFSNWTSIPRSTRRPRLIGERLELEPLRVLLAYSSGSLFFDGNHGGELGSYTLSNW